MRTNLTNNKMNPTPTANNIIGTETIILTPAAEIRFKELSVIVDNMRNTVAAGRALAEIHSEKLYQKVYPLWASYCENVLDLTPQRAHQLISSAVLADFFMKECGIAEELIPQTERSMRVLLGLDKELRHSALLSAIKNSHGKRPTFEILLGVVEAMSGKKSDVKISKKKFNFVNAFEAMMTVLEGAPTDEYSIQSLRKLKKLSKVLTCKISALERESIEEELMPIIVSSTETAPTSSPPPDISNEDELAMSA